MPEKSTFLSAVDARLSKPDSKEPDYGKRPDGSKKSTGFLGEIRFKGPDGKEGVATEYSTQSGAVKVNGKQVDFPTLVPTLTEDELKAMRDDIIPNKKPVPEPIMQKAIQHANMRISKGLSPFR